ncbi:MAG TPA: hypothetical protein P5509_04985 [Bacteroidales bacterium]|nr:hypothetical protein [Bacteroidales bacterium]
MEIKLTKAEAEGYYYSALCNGGLQELRACGVTLDTDVNDYKAAKESLQKKLDSGEITLDLGICYEDIIMEILHIGKTLKFIDKEYDGEYSREVTLEMVHEKVAKTPIRHLTDYIKENDDAITAFVLLQAVMYDGEMIFA